MTSQEMFAEVDPIFSTGGLLSLPVEPHIRIWLANAHARGTLISLIEALIRLRAVNNHKEGLEYCINTILRNNKLETTDEGLSFGDLQMSHPVILRHHTKRILERETPSDAPIRMCQSMGVVSHMLMAWLSRTPRVIEPTRQLGLFDGDPAAPMTQLTLFEQPAILDRQFLMFKHVQTPTGPPQNLPTEFHISTAELKNVERTCAAILPLTASADAFSGGRWNATEDLRNFRNAMAKILHPWICYLESIAAGALGEYLALVSLASWAQVIVREEIYAQREALAMSEIPVLPRSWIYGIQAGRIDRFDVYGLNGSRASFGAPKFPSAFEAIRILGTHSPAFEATITDWKFPVGDFRGRVGTRESLPAMQNHQRQVRWYKLLLGIAGEITSGIRWGTNQLKPQLSYLLPEGPVVTMIPHGERDLEEHFRGLVVDTWGKIRQTHDTRIIDHWVVRHLRMLEERLMQPHATPIVFGQTATNALTAPPLQEPLFDVSANPHPIADLVERHRDYVDQHHIVERVGDGTKRYPYILHLTALRKAISEGHIAVGRDFDVEWVHDEFMVGCPLHEDKTPSLRIYRDHAFCFGCRQHFRFAYESIPHDLYWIRSGMPGTHKPRRKIMDIQIADDHRAIMEAAQASLQEYFLRGRGADYLSNVRKIDPEIAFAYGAGYGTNTLWWNLLEAGFTFDQLVKYGFVEFSQFFSSDTEEFHYSLQCRGIPRSELVRVERSIITGCEIEYYAYFPWKKRLTFPLVIPVYGKPVINSFYGRATWADAKLKHRKSRVLKVDVSHGLMNGASLIASPETTINNVYVTEGALDTLVLLTLNLGGAPIVSFCGTGNDQGVAWLAHAKPKTVYTALDFDKAGQDATEKMKIDLARHGFSGEVQNYCRLFAFLHPEVDFLKDADGKPVIDDFGKWWEVLSEEDRRDWIMGWYDTHNRIYEEQHAPEDVPCDPIDAPF
jgi:hypothetical protein